MPGLKFLPMKKILRCIETSNSFMFVRHPIGRVLSAYKNKVLRKLPYRMKALVRLILEYHGMKNQNPEIANVTFPQFVDWITNTGSVNNHWRSFIDICHPCNINYTFTGRVETLASDLYHIMKKFYGERIASEWYEKQPRLNQKPMPIKSSPEE